MPDWTTMQVEKATANKFRKLAVDTGEEIRDLATRALDKGYTIVRDEIRSAQRNTTTTP